VLLPAVFDLSSNGVGDAIDEDDVHASLGHFLELLHRGGEGVEGDVEVFAHVVVAEDSEGGVGLVECFLAATLEPCALVGIQVLLCMLLGLPPQSALGGGNENLATRATDDIVAGRGCLDSGNANCHGASPSVLMFRCCTSSAYNTIIYGECQI